LLTLLAALGLALTAQAAPFSFPSPKTITIIDALGIATPATKFNIGGTAAWTIGPTQSVGTRFTLTRDTFITEIGGFVNNFSSNSPILVQIRPSVAGIPSTSTVIATFRLSNDDNPVIFSFESVNPRLILKAGTYFALFALPHVPEGSVGGGLLENAPLFSPPYAAGPLLVGILDPATGTSSIVEERGAVRILGRVPNAADLLAALLKKVVDEALGPGTSFAAKLKAASDALNVNDPTATYNILTSFVNEVKAQAGHALSVEQATQLIDAVNQIKITI
jgi:hypothetical protein